LSTKVKEKDNNEEVKEFFESVKSTIEKANKVMDVLEKKFDQDSIVSFILVSTYNLYHKDEKEFLTMQKTFLETFDAMAKAGVIKFRKTADV
jgi:hypothetical protein